MKRKKRTPRKDLFRLSPTPIKTIAPKISDAIGFMIEGLERVPKRSHFTLEMQTYGSFDEGICYGCAATCTIIRMYNVKIGGSAPPFSFRGSELSHGSLFLDTSVDLREFEEAINSFRLGYISPLFTYYGEGAAYRKFGLNEYAQKWMMDNDNWRAELPKVKAFRELLMSRGL